MQTIYWINKLTSRIASALRQRHNAHLSAALSRELALANPRMRAEIELLIANTTPTGAIAAAPKYKTTPTATVTSTQKADVTRSAPVAVLPNRLRYSTS